MIFLLSDLPLFELDQEPGVPLNDVWEVSNYVAALDHGLRLLEVIPGGNSGDTILIYFFFGPGSRYMSDRQ